MEELSRDQRFQLTTELIRKYLNNGKRRPLDLFHAGRLADPKKDGITIVGFCHLLAIVGGGTIPKEIFASTGVHSIHLFRDFGAEGVARGGILSFHCFRAALRPNSRMRGRSNGSFSSTEDGFNHDDESIARGEKEKESNKIKRRMRRMRQSMDNPFPMDALGFTPSYSSTDQRGLLESGGSSFVFKGGEGGEYDKMEDDQGMLIMTGGGIPDGGSELPSIAALSNSSSLSSSYMLHGGKSRLLESIENDANSFLPFIRLAAASARASTMDERNEEENDEDNEEEDRRNTVDEEEGGQERDDGARSRRPSRSSRRRHFEEGRYRQENEESSSSAWWDPESETMLARQMEVDLILGSPSPAFDPSVPFAPERKSTHAIMSMEHFKTNPIEQINQYQGVLERAIAALQASKAAGCGKRKRKKKKRGQEEQQQGSQQQPEVGRDEAASRRNSSSAGDYSGSLGGKEPMMGMSGGSSLLETSASTLSNQTNRKRTRRKRKKINQTVGGQSGSKSSLRQARARRTGETTVGGIDLNNDGGSDDNNIMSKWWMERRMHVIEKQLLPTVMHLTMREEEQEGDRRPRTASSFLDESHAHDLAGMSDLTPRPSTSHAEARPFSVHSVMFGKEEEENKKKENTVIVQHKAEALEKMLSHEEKLKSELKRLRMLKKKKKEIESKSNEGDEKKKTNE